MRWSVQNRQTCECDNLPIWNSFLLKSGYGQSSPFTHQYCCHLWRPDVEGYFQILLSHTARHSSPKVCRVSQRTLWQVWSVIIFGLEEVQGMYCFTAVTVLLNATKVCTAVPLLGDYLQQWKGVSIRNNTLLVNIPPVSTTKSSLSQTRPVFVNQ